MNPVVMILAIVAGFLVLLLIVRPIARYFKRANMEEIIERSEFVRGRDSLDDDKFIDMLALPRTSEVFVIVEEARNCVAKAAQVPSQLIYPSDEFTGNLLGILEWPDVFDTEPPLTVRIEDRLGIHLSDRAWESISAPEGQSGTVRDMVLEIVELVKTTRT